MNTIFKLFLIFAIDYRSSEASQEPKPNHWLEQTIPNIKIFNKLFHAEVKFIVDHAVLIDVKKGDIIITQGDVGNSLYVIESGRFDILQKKGGIGEETIINVLKKGDSIGVMSLVYGEKLNRTATVVAATDGRIYKLN